MTRLVAVGILAVAILGAGCSHHRSRQSNVTSGAPSYDVKAAHLCQAFEVFVVDAKKGSGTPADRSALDSARQALSGDRGPKGTWSSLLTTMTDFLTAAADGNGHLVDLDGLRISHVCGQIPPPAKHAGGYRG